MEMFEGPTPYEKLIILEQQVQDCLRMIQEMAHNSANLAEGLNIQQKHLVEVNRSIYNIQKHIMENKDG